MGEQETIKIGYSDYITSQEEARLVKNVVLPKLKQNKNVNIFCSFSYFTSNYTGINLMKELSNLVKEGCTVYLLMWDINCECHPYFLRLLKQEKMTAEQILEDKMKEILSIFQSFGTNMSRLHLYRASDVLGRFIRKQNPNLFIRFYGVMEKLDLNGLLHKHKASHLLQMPLDIFFAYYFHELYPEDISGRIESVICYTYQEKLFREVRKVMHGEEAVNKLHPLIITLPEYPYLAYDSALPDWGMSRDTTVQHILSFKPNTIQMQQIYDVVLSKFLKDFEILDDKGKINTVTYAELHKKLSALSLENQQVSLAYNLYTFLQNIKESVTIRPTSRILHLSPTETIRYAKILGRKRMIDILHSVDGTQNATQLSKKLKIARSNMSNYLQLLKKHKLVEIDEKGIVHRKAIAVTTNFEYH